MENIVRNYLEIKSFNELLEIKNPNNAYILNKLRFMQDYRKNQENNLLTDLPTWQNNPEVQFYNRKIFN